MSGIFNSVKGNKIRGRSSFDLSNEYLTTGDMGLLYPTFAAEVVPGDYFNLNNFTVIRFNPLIAPILHNIFITIHYFFVPFRILWDNWENFITGGEDGDWDVEAIPRWSPTLNAEESLWDYFGFPINIVPLGALPMDFYKRAYNKIWNEYYRDETLQNAIDEETSEDVKRRNWTKDYFTSGLNDRQRGTAPAMPLSGNTDFTNAVGYLSASWTNVNVDTPGAQLTAGASGAADAALLSALNKNDLSSAVTFDVNDMRTAVQIQRFLELNMRGGVRYTEWLRAHFDVAPRDDRLQRPEYIGGTKANVIISEVLQTSESATTAQGNLAGHGVVAAGNHAGKYHAKEYGCIIGMLSVMPEGVYQQGIDRQFLRRSRYDFYNPLFANLGEQGVELAEIFASGVATENESIFCYQGRFDEMRVKKNMVTALMRSDAATNFDYWHLARDFSTAPALNSDFIECNPTKRIFAVPSEPGLIINVRNQVTGHRPMPYLTDPGYMDH